MTFERKKIRALIIDDDPGDVALLTRYLSEMQSYEFEFTSAVDIEHLDFNKKLKGMDLIFVDYYLGRETGLDILKRLADQECDMPVIILTGQGNEEIAVEAMRLGAADYLVKDTLSAANLEKSISFVFEKYRLQREIRQYQEQLEQKVMELEESLDHVKQLQGLIPICMHCKRIRDDQNMWQKIEQYISSRSDAEFSHSICEDCAEQLYGDFRSKGKITKL